MSWKKKLQVWWSWKKYKIYENTPKRKRLRAIEDFISEVTWIVREHCFEEEGIRKKLDELAKGCTLEMMKFEGEDHDIEVMTWASLEYKRYYNSIVAKVMKKMEEVRFCDVKLVGKDKAIIRSTWCGILSTKGIPEKIKEKTGRKIIWASEKDTVMNAIYRGIHRQEYAMCANSLEELL